MSKSSKLLPELPQVAFPLLPLRNGVLFPGTVVTIPVGRERSRKLIEDLSPGAVVGVAVQRDPRTLDPSLADLQPVGTYAVVRQIAKAGERSYRIVLAGIGRFKLSALLQGGPYWRATGEVMEDTVASSVEAKLLAQSLGESLREQLEELLPEALNRVSQWVSDLGRSDRPGLFADRVAGALNLPTEKEVQILLTQEVSTRLRQVATAVAETRELAKLRRKIDSEVRRDLGQQQREVLLRQQMRAIQRELGEGADGDEGSELRSRLEAMTLPDEVQKAVSRELRRLESLNPGQPEAGVIRNYLECIADLPWDRRAEGGVDLKAVRDKLDADHAGLESVKKRILEHMAVIERVDRARATILCLAGPPGVGKTSLGQSIADAIGRPFIRIALGGVRDEAEIRGHRRTYIGALPGRIINGMKRAGVRNPVILLDEIDKLGQGFLGSPESALLEVLDPEQNATFTDHYLELPFDLSEAIFICTANHLPNLSAPLRDRLEIIELSGYTTREKLEIARVHLLPRHLREHALDPSTLQVSDAALEAIIRDYTREAGVRQLGRELTKLCRAVTLELAQAGDSKPQQFSIEPERLRHYLGKVRFQDEVAERTALPGVATGLAWTPVGGDILFVETSRMPGKGSLEITGQLGDVMKESARAALTYLRSHADDLGIDTAFLAEQDVHIHVPAGAVPKDGPSAGVTIFTALVSLLTGSRVRPDTAMTGECTLRGRVLPVGGIKSKVLAAHRAGLTRVILPARNRRDLDDVPEDVRDAMEFVFASDMREVLAQALEQDVHSLQGVEEARANETVAPDSLA